MFKNKGDLQLSALADSFLGDPTLSNGAAFGDLDNDGDLDLVVNNINAKASLYENKLNQGGLTITLSHPQHANINGTTIHLYAEGKRYVQTKSTTRGFQSGSSHKVHFGVPSTAKIDSLLIHWPNGKLNNGKRNFIPTIGHRLCIPRTNRIQQSETPFLSYPFCRLNMRKTIISTMSERV